jgi:hypothetical protein
MLLLKADFNGIMDSDFINEKRIKVKKFFSAEIQKAIIQIIKDSNAEENKLS